MPDPLSPLISPSPYIDESGNAQLRDSIVGFLDLLGFSQSIRITEKLADAQLLVNKILAAINDSRHYVRETLASEFAANPKGWGVKFFSDNLVVGHPVEGHNVTVESATRFVIRCAQRYQLRMAFNGFFLRGALSRGLLCLTDDIIFGSALLESYQLESKASIVPRVILSESLKDAFTRTCRTDAGYKNLANSICRDIDGWWFVSYLEAASDGTSIDWALVERHQQAIRQSLAGVTAHDVLPKYGWACRYHNMFCHWYRDAPGYSDRYRIDRGDETSLLLRLGETL